VQRPAFRGRGRPRHTKVAGKKNRCATEIKPRLTSKPIPSAGEAPPGKFAFRGLLRPQAKLDYTSGLRFGSRLRFSIARRDVESDDSRRRGFSRGSRIPASRPLAIGIQIEWTYHCHSHPHWQRTVSRSRTFIMTLLHTAHDRIHITRSRYLSCLARQANKQPSCQSPSPGNQDKNWLIFGQKCFSNPAARKTAAFPHLNRQKSPPLRCVNSRTCRPVYREL